MTATLPAGEEWLKCWTLVPSVVRISLKAPLYVISCDCRSEDRKTLPQRVNNRLPSSAIHRSPHMPYHHDRVSRTACSLSPVKCRASLYRLATAHCWRRKWPCRWGEASPTYLIDLPATARESQLHSQCGYIGWSPTDRGAETHRCNRFRPRQCRSTSVVTGSVSPMRHYSSRRTRSGRCAQQRQTGHPGSRRHCLETVAASPSILASELERRHEVDPGRLKPSQFAQTSCCIPHPQLGM